MSVFDAYRGKHTGETAVILGTGPSLKDADHRIFDGACLIGSNEAVYLPYVVDYYFIGDAGSLQRGYRSDPGTYQRYTPRKQKFIRSKTTGSYAAMPEGLSDAVYYRTGGDSHGKSALPVLNLDLSNGPYDAGSISFEALQFALWCGFKRILLVGHDCTYAAGSFHAASVNAATNAWGNVIYASWERTGRFLTRFCPDVEVLSYRPVRLRMFPEVKV